MDKEVIHDYIFTGAQAVFHDNVAVFEVPVSRIKEYIRDLYYRQRCSLTLITATDERTENECFKIWYLLAIPGTNVVLAPYIILKNSEKFPSLTPIIYEACSYEKKIQSFFGLIPVGHPDPRLLVLHENWPAGVFPLRKDVLWNQRPPIAREKYEFQKVHGEGIYEIPVGPIHAGIIEPGHFRFSVAGEEIILLEPRLGFVHKGIEKLFEIMPIADALRLSEKISGDSSFSYSLAFCQALETLGNMRVPERAQYLRTVYAELERLANHLGDIGAIMLDTGFNFGGSHGARLREMVMMINERLTGSRFLRKVNVIGGVASDINSSEAKRLIEDLKKIEKDFSEVVKIASSSASLLGRLEGTGILTSEVARRYGVVGLAARASGIATDTRLQVPYAAYQALGFSTIETEKNGDVHARFLVRIKEVMASFKLVTLALSALPEGPISAKTPTIALKKNAIALSMVEGWRGQIVYFVATDSKGNISRLAPRDPSFLNWPAVGEVGFGNVVPDFPLINKSFNLSYSGNDL